MPLHLSPLILTDFTTLTTHPTSTSSAPTTAAEIQARHLRLQESVASSRADFLRDPTGRWYKVVDDSDPSNPVVVSIARWHVYDQGYDSSRDCQAGGTEGLRRTEDVFLEMRGWPWPNENREARWRDLNAKKRVWRDRNIRGEKVIVLAMLFTREDHQRRGAGKLLMDDMCRQADELGFKVYLEGSDVGRKLYRSVGCVETGEVIREDCGGDEYVRWVMVREPRK